MDATDPPPFDTMGEDALLEWAAQTWTRWQQLPAALAELRARRVEFSTIHEATGVPTTTAHRKAKSGRTACVSAAATPMPAATMST